MSLDKKIQETFNPPPSLEGEDWLMPSEDLFDSIEEAIYDEPKRKFAWFWIVPLLFASGIFLYFSLFTDNKAVIVAENVVADAPSNINDRNDIFVDKAEPKQGVTVIDNSYNNQEQTTKLESRTNYKISETNTDFGKAASTNLNKFKANEKLISNTIDYNVISRSSLIGASNRNDITDSDKFDNSFSSSSFTTTYANDFVAKLNRHSNQNMFFDRPMVVSNLVPFIISIDEKVDLGWKARLGLGFSNWNFDLNNNYLAALQPADFSSTDGNGYLFEVGIEREISNRVSIALLLSADQSSFKSGHNSVIDYNTLTEKANHTNDFDLTMASPLGFLESNIVIARSVDAEEHTDLTINLDNRHTVTNLDLGVFSQIELLKFNDLTLGTQLGGGINYLSMVSNQLNNFTTSEFGFQSHSSEIIENQNNLSLLRPYLGVGLNIEYRWTHDISIGLNHQYRQDLNAIYNSGDYSTLVSRQLSSFYIAKSI